tara:strand:- start:358 stop:1584 length:1227 start_codon:yes stop_codon:yes gene_type:complete
MDAILIECSPGISGDMLLAAFYDLGVPQTVFEEPLIKLGLKDFFSLSFNESRSYNLRGVNAEVNVLINNKKKKWKDIKTFILSGLLDKNLELMIIKVFELLAIAEGKVHGIHPDELHFHEIGSTDSLVDVIGVCAAINYLKPKNIFCNSPNLGKGFINSEHGKIPIPSPVVLELISSSEMKISSKYSIEEELSTPTGISLLLTLVNFFEFPSEYSINSYGIGIGHKTLPYPNLLRVLKIDLPENKENYFKNRPVFEEISIQEAWIDDHSSEEIASFIEFMRQEGVLDISYEPINMKKNRIGFSLVAIVPVEREAHFRELWFQYTNTIGLRERRQGRWTLPRREGECVTSFGKVKCKEITKPNGEKIIKPEHDDVMNLQKKYRKTALEVRNIINNTMKDFKPFKDLNEY